MQSDLVFSVYNLEAQVKLKNASRTYYKSVPLMMRYIRYIHYDDCIHLNSHLEKSISIKFLLQRFQITRAYLVREKYKLIGLLFRVIHL